MATPSELAMLEQLSEQPAPYLALERFVYGSDRGEALAVLARLAEEGKVRVTMAGRDVALSRIERWAETPLDPAHGAELGAIEVDITAAGLAACLD